MQHYFAMATLTALVIAGAGIGCRQSDQRVPRAEEGSGLRMRDQANTARDSFDEQKRQAETRLSDHLKDLDGKMAELKAKAQTAGDKAKAEWEQQRPKLEAQRAEASKKLDELRASTKETWENVSRKTEAAFGELERGFKDAWAKLKE